jgi:2-polyprenyl-3-methyl-5-hydroxy-6-metoxy-1,4-benzoquinol methylase
VLLRPDGLPVAWCPECALGYVAALPPAEEIAQVYAEYWSAFRPKDLSPAAAVMVLAEGEEPSYRRRLNRLQAVTGGLPGLRLLDVGCGRGEFLVAARRRGAVVVGNDISPESCAFVRERLGSPVFAGPLAAPEFLAQYGAMDVVVMNDLLEHPAEPLALLQAALEVLRPGGWLLIWTPNGGNIARDLATGGEFIALRTDLEHLQYLSAGTVAVLAGRYDCRIEHLETWGYPNPPRPEGWAPRMPRPGSLRSQLKRSRLARKLVRTARAARVYLSGGAPDPECGNYHLLTILRKAGAPEAE